MSRIKQFLLDEQSNRLLIVCKHQVPTVPRGKITGKITLYLSAKLMKYKNRCIQNPVKHLRQSAIRKQLMAKSQLLSQNSPF